MKPILLCYFWSYFIVQLAADDSNLFQLAPTNVSIYYDNPKKIHLDCVPPAQSKVVFNLTWWKDGVMIPKVSGTNESRIKIQSKIDAGILAVHNLVNVSTMSRLLINPANSSDSGEYSCVASNGTHRYASKLNVLISDDCKSDAFKCKSDKKCIMSYAVCDGNPHCSDNYDESMDAGCLLPSAPKNLTLEKITSDLIQIKWQPVAKVKNYEVHIIRPDNTSEIQRLKETLSLIKELKPDSKYKIKVAARSLTGLGNFTDELLVTTKRFEPPGVPTNLKGQSATISDIKMVWNEVEDADTYEIVLQDTNDKVLKKKYTEKLKVLFQDLIDNTTYRFKVRAKSLLGFGNYSEQVESRTLKLYPPGPPLDVMIVIKGRHIQLSWKSTNDYGNTDPLQITYQAEFCYLKPYDSRMTMHDTVKNEGVEVNKSDTQYKTLYQKTNCDKTEFSRHRKFERNFNSGSYLSYNLTTFGANKIRGGSRGGRFNISMDNTPTMTTTATTTISSTPATKENPGLIVFGICSGGLIVILVISFLFAWACKWKFLQDGINEYHAVMSESTREEEARKQIENNHGGVQHFMVTENTYEQL